MKDLTIPPAKSGILDRSHTEVADIEQQYREGIITRTEKYNKVVDVWTKATNDVADAMMREPATTPWPTRSRTIPRTWSTRSVGRFPSSRKSGATASTRSS